MVKAKKDDKIKTVELIINELVKLMGVDVKIEVVEDKEQEMIVVNLDSKDEAGLLIGNMGETINSLQNIVGIIYRQKTGEWQRILINVGGWREKQEDKLKQMAQQTAERAKETGQPQNLYNLKPNQRRIIHMILSEDKDVITESVGEDDERYLVVKTAPKENK